MIKIIFSWTLIILLTACNVAEQNAVLEKESQDVSIPNRGLEDGKTYFSFDRPTYYASHYWDEDGASQRIRIKRSGALGAKTLKIQITQTTNQALIADISSISLNGTALTIYSGSPVDSHYYVDVPFTESQVILYLDVTLNDDALYEGDELLSFTLVTDGTQNYSLGTYSSTTRTIVDDETPPDVFLRTTSSTGASQTVNEGATASIDVVLTSAAEFPVHVSLVLSGSTESADHNFYTQTITIPAGSTTHQIDVITATDSYSEPLERATITIASSQGATLNATRDLVYDLDITDTTAGSNEVSISGLTTLNENSAPLTVTATLTLNGTIDKNVLVPITLAGTATEGVDYTISVKEVLFKKDMAAGTTADVVISVINDDVFEGAEDIQVTIGSTAETVPDASPTLTINLNDDEVSPVAQFAGTNYLTQEGQTFYLPLSLNNAVPEPFSLDFVVDLGVANPPTLGSDTQIAASGTFTIPAGQTKTLIPIYMNNDNVFDDNETLRITISNPSCPTLAACAATGLGANSTIDILIKEEGESLPKISFTASGQSANEGATINITATVDKVSQQNQPFTVALYNTSATNDDHTGLVTSQQIDAGTLSKTFTITLVDDTIDELSEQFEIKLLQPSGMILGNIIKHTVTITDQDVVPIIDVASVPTTVAEGSSGLIQFSLAAGNTPSENLIINYTVSGTSTPGIDHDLQSNTVTLPKGQTSVSVPFNVINDGQFEGGTDETLIVTISSSFYYSPGTGVSTTNLTDAQAAAVVAFNANDVSVTTNASDYITVIENDLVSVPFSLSYPVNTDITLTFTVDDRYDSDQCDTLSAGNIQCANIIDYGVIHAGGMVQSNCDFTTGGSTTGSCQTISGEIFTRVTFTNIPDGGSLDITTPSGSYAITDADITGASIQAVAQNLANQINGASLEVTQELYAHYKSGNDYVDIYPIQYTFDTDLDQQLSGAAPSNTITATIPAGQTSGKIEFRASNDLLYESTVYEAFKIDLISVSDPTTVTIDPVKDSVEVRIKDINTAPTAKFSSSGITKQEGGATLMVPVELSTSSQVAASFRVKFIQSATPLAANFADENDFFALTTLSNGSSSAISNITPNTSLSSPSPLPVFYKSLYNENEESFDSFDISTATNISLTRMPNVSTRMEINGLPSGSFTINGVPFDTTNAGTFPNYTATPSIANFILDLETYFAATSPFDDLIISSDALASPAYIDMQPNMLSALVYQNDGGSFADGEIKLADIQFPVGQKIAYVPVRIEEDYLFEGDEEFTLILEPIAFPVSASANEYRVTIQDNEVTPTLSFSTTPASSVTEGSVAGGISNIAESSIYTYLDLDYTVSLSVALQHSDANFDVIFGGDVSYQDNASITPSAFMQGDFFLDTSMADANFTVAQTDAQLSVTYPKGYMGLDLNVRARVHQDYRYEEAENLTVDIQNSVNASLGSPSTFTTSIDDPADVAPEMYVLDPTSAPTADINEYDNANRVIEIRLKDSYNDCLGGTAPCFYGANITEVDLTATQQIDLTMRHSVGTTSATETASFNSSNNWEWDYSFDMSSLGDFRQFSTVTFNIIEPASDATIDTADTFYLLSGADNTLQINYNIAVGDIIVKPSRFSEVDSAGQTFKGHTCIAHRGQVICFGNNSQGQLGRGSAAASWGQDDLTGGDKVTDQSNVISLGTENGIDLYVKDIAVGRAHTCALFTNDKVKCWGDNTYGQLGLGLTVANKGTSASDMGDNLAYVDLGVSDPIKSIKAMADATCAWFEPSASDDYIKCWGRNEYGQLGIEASTSVIIGDEIADMGSDLDSVIFPGSVMMFETGAYHACAVNTSNTVRCWGRNDYGQLGNNITEAVVGDDLNEMQDWWTYDLTFNDTSAAYINDEIQGMALGTYHTCINFNSTAVSNYNTRCFGNNQYGQLGLGRATKAGAVYSNLYAWADTFWNNSNALTSIGATANTNAYYLEPFTSAGHIAGQANRAFIPYDSAVANSENIGVTNNQWTQIYAPTKSIAAGSTFGCAKVDSYIFGTTSYGQAIRCWGSNYIDQDEDGSVTNSPSEGVDLGVLNNFGHSNTFSGTEPFTGSSLTVPPFDSAYSSPGAAAINASNLSDMTSRVAVIGDSGINLTGNDLIGDFYNGTNDGSQGNNYQWGWVDNLHGVAGQKINFEMNSVYSMVELDFSTYADVELSGGAHHICALPRQDTLSQDSTTIDNTFVCWGSNHAGQTGIDHNDGCKTDVVGAADSCNDAANGQIMSVDFTY